MQLNRILIIDDDATTCFLHKLLLQDLQIAQEIDYMTNPNTALQHVKDRYAAVPPESFTGPDLILLDMDMPLMSGLQFMQELEALPLDRTKLFVVMLTASLADKDRQIADRMSFKLDGYQVKPLNKAVMDELMTHIAHSTHEQ